MGIRIEKENVASRTTGNKVKDSLATLIYKGTVIVKEKNGSTGVIEVRPYLNADGTAANIPAGLAIDQNYKPPVAPDNNQTVGEGYDFTDYNRGGMVAAIDDATVWVKGNSLVKGDDTWDISQPVFWDGDNARFTDTSAATTVLVGVLTDKVVVTAVTTELRIKIKLFA
jgi:hypothetical protein